MFNNMFIGRKNGVWNNGIRKNAIRKNAMRDNKGNINKGNDGAPARTASRAMCAAVFIVCAALLTACGKNPINPAGKSFVLEQGNTVPKDVGIYVNGKPEELAKCTLDISAVKADTVGTYEAKVIHPDKTVKFTIQVVDTTGPEVELYANEFYTAPGQAVDLYDVLKSINDNTSFTVGFADDITKADSEKVLSDKITFDKAGAYNSEICARDSYGNMTVIPIVIMVMEDRQAPVLSGVGKTIYTSLGKFDNLFNNVTAQDNIDGDITDKIVFDISAVDFNTAGTYTARISVRDSSGNEAVESVTVIVQNTSEILNPPGPELPPEGGDFAQYSTDKVPFGFGNETDPETNRPTGIQWYINHYGQYSTDFIQPLSNYIFLTFDEGYENGCTAQILDILKEKNVKAVFFVTLSYVKDQPDLVRRMIDEGHVVGNHSATHPSAGISSLTVDKQIEEVKRVNDYVLDNFGYQMYLFRFPEGAFSEQSLAVVQSQGYRSVFWSFAHRDWVTDDQPDVAESLEKALNKAHGGAIYLLHAVSTTNTAMLGDFIDGCRAKGFEFGYYGKVE